MSNSNSYHQFTIFINVSHNIVGCGNFFAGFDRADNDADFAIIGYRVNIGLKDVFNHVGHLNHLLLNNLFDHMVVNYFSLILSSEVEAGRTYFVHHPCRTCGIIIY